MWKTHLRVQGVRHLPYEIHPAIRHKWMRPALTSASMLPLDLPILEERKAELTKAARQCTDR